VSLILALQHLTDESIDVWVLSDLTQIFTTSVPLKVASGLLADSQHNPIPLRVIPNSVCRGSFECADDPPVIAGLSVTCFIRNLTDAYDNPVQGSQQYRSVIVTPASPSYVLNITVSPPGLVDPDGDYVRVTMIPVKAGQIAFDMYFKQCPVRHATIRVAPAGIDPANCPVACLDSESRLANPLVGATAGQLIQCQVLLYDAFTNPVLADLSEANRRLGWIEPPVLTNISMMPVAGIANAWLLQFTVTVVGEYVLQLTLDHTFNLSSARDPVPRLHITASIADCRTSTLVCPGIEADDDLSVSAGTLLNCGIIAQDAFGNLALFPDADIPFVSSITIQYQTIKGNRTSPGGMAMTHRQNASIGQVQGAAIYAGEASLVVAFAACAEPMMSPFVTVLPGDLVMSSLMANCTPPIVEVSQQTACYIIGLDQYGNFALTPDLLGNFSASMNLTCADTCNAFKPCGSFDFPLYYWTVPGASGLAFNYSFQRASIAAVEFYHNDDDVPVLPAVHARTTVTCPLGSELVGEECRCLPGTCERIVLA